MKKIFVKKVEWDWRDYWGIFWTTNFVFMTLSYIFVLIGLEIHYISISISLIITIFIVPFFEIKRKVYFEEM